MTLANTVNTVTCVILHPEMGIKCWGIHVCLMYPCCFCLTAERAFKHRLRKQLFMKVLC